VPAPSSASSTALAIAAISAGVDRWVTGSVSQIHRAEHTEAVERISSAATGRGAPRQNAIETARASAGTARANMFEPLSDLQLLQLREICSTVLDRLHSEYEFPMVIGLLISGAGRLTSGPVDPVECIEQATALLCIQRTDPSDAATKMSTKIVELQPVLARRPVANTIVQDGAK